MKEGEYERDLAIDPYCLDEEWLRQPGLYMRYSAMAVDAEKKRNQAKEKIDVVKAELEKKIRNNPTLCGVEKITESVVAAAVILQPEYKIANDELTEATYQFNMIQSAVRAFDHRRSALENEVKLWLGNYFSGPKQPREIPEGKRIVDMARDKVSSRMREEVNKSISIGDRMTEKTASVNGQMERDQPRRRRDK